MIILSIAIDLELVWQLNGGQIRWKKPQREKIGKKTSRMMKSRLGCAFLLGSVRCEPNCSSGWITGFQVWFLQLQSSHQLLMQFVIPNLFVYEEINILISPFNYFIPALDGFLFCTIVAISFGPIILCTLLKITYHNLEPLGEFKLKYYFDHSQLVSYLLAIP